MVGCRPLQRTELTVLATAAHQEALELGGRLERGARPLLRLRLALQRGGAGINRVDVCTSQVGSPVCQLFVNS